MNSSNLIDPDEFFRRFFEPFPADGLTRFRPGDTVRLVREEQFFGFPAGALGQVLSVDDPEGSMAAKGRPFLVQLDLRPFKVAVPADLRAMIREQTGHDEPYFLDASVYVGPNDLELVTRPGDAVESDLFWNGDISADQRAMLAFLRERAVEVGVKARHGSVLCRDLLEGYHVWQQTQDTATLIALVAAIRNYRKWVATCEFTALADWARGFDDLLDVPDNAGQVYRLLDQLGMVYVDEDGAWRRKV
ncbi:MAG: hypothetical protein OHK0046_46290 [Anaerolineae bacterium]